jgi:hypothetical protein
MSVGGFSGDGQVKVLGRFSPYTSQRQVFQTVFSNFGSRKLPVHLRSSQEAVQVAEIVCVGSCNRSCRIDAEWEGSPEDCISAGNVERGDGAIGSAHEAVIPPHDPHAGATM